MSKQVDCFQWILHNYRKINLVQFQNNASALFVNNVYRVLGVRPTRSGIGTPRLMVLIENELTMPTSVCRPEERGMLPNQKWFFVFWKIHNHLGGIYVVFRKMLVHHPPCCLYTFLIVVNHLGRYLTHFKYKYYVIVAR